MSVMLVRAYLVPVERCVFFVYADAAVPPELLFLIAFWIEASVRLLFIYICSVGKCFLQRIYRPYCKMETLVQQHFGFISLSYIFNLKY